MDQSMKTDQCVRLFSSMLISYARQIISIILVCTDKMELHVGLGQEFGVGITGIISNFDFLHIFDYFLT